jgi:gamma-glutamyltranspeptidase/glutathione hydrolase
VSNTVGNAPSPLWQYPYPSRRMPVMGRNVVATSQPLAAQAGLRMLQQGGNAVDAALAAAIALTVVEPTSNGLGSDAFALVWDGQTLTGINGSGRSPGRWTPERFAGREAMPVVGWEAVTVPGAVDAWVQLSDRFGDLPFDALFGPAVAYAAGGYPVSPLTARRWAEAAETYRDFEAFAATFLPEGRAPRPGEIFRCPEMARTLQEIGETRGASFYRGALAERIADDAAAHGAALSREDLAGHRSDWVTPLTVAYRDVEVHEIPPNGQGLAALVALGVLARFDLAAHAVDAADSLHLQIEAMKIGFAVAACHIADPRCMRHAPEDFLTSAFLDRQAGTIRRERAGGPAAPLPFDAGTVYLTAADHRGGMVSMIQSNFTGFGSGVVVPGTGISLQNRALGFTLEKGHPNTVDGGKRPYHTIIPGFVTRDGRALVSFGVMGGYMQPQGHVQMVVRLCDYGQNPQSACDAPRWHIAEDGRLSLEPGIPAGVKRELSRRGHVVVDEDPYWGYGGAQIIVREGDSYCAGSDPRKDGQAVAF